MLNREKLLHLQSKRGSRVISDDIIQRDLRWAVEACREFIRNNADEYRNLDGDKKREVIIQKIVEYVMRESPMVEGFVDSDNKIDSNGLVEELVKEITDYGILTEAMVDERVNEIRINGKEIKIEYNNKIVDLTENFGSCGGNVITFTSREQQDIIFRKIMGDTRLNPKYSRATGRTVEGYRYEALHSSILSVDPHDPNGEAYNAMVLRKFKKDKMTLINLIENGTISDDMAKFFRVMVRGGFTFLTVGPTSSGKTTTNNAILQEIPDDIRSVFAQNPSEIDARKRDRLTNRVLNDQLYIEVREVENPTPYDPTMGNMLAAILRLSPDFVTVGEYRKPAEFRMGTEINLAGHPVNGTFHAQDAREAIVRYVQAYMSGSTGESERIVAQTVARMIDFIVVQRKMDDGTRKVVQIAEVLGFNSDTEEADIRDIFTFDKTGEHEYDEETDSVTRIVGEHRRVGTISKESLKKLTLKGVRTEMYQFLAVEPDKDESGEAKFNEKYTGRIYRKRELERLKEKSDIYSNVDVDRYSI